MRGIGWLAVVAAAVVAMSGPAGAGPDAPSMPGGWDGLGADGSLLLDVTAQQGRRFTGEVSGLGGEPMPASGTVSHETGASDGVNRVVIDMRPPVGPPTIFQGDLLTIGDPLSGLDLLAGRTVRAGRNSPLAALRLDGSASALASTWSGEVELRLPGGLEPLCVPIAVSFGGRTARGVSLTLGDDALGGLHAVDGDASSAQGFALVAQGVVEGEPNSVLVLIAQLSGLDLIQGDATLLPGDGGKAATGSFSLKPPANP